MKKIITLPLYLLLLVVVLIIAIVYVYYFTTLPETEINAWLRSFGDKKFGVNISFEKVNRDLWNGLQLEGVEIYPTSGSERSLARISKLDFKYDLADILRGNYHLQALTIDSLNIKIPENGYSFPSSSQGAGGRPSTISLSIDNIHLRRANINLKNGDLVTLDSLESSLFIDKGKLNFRVSHLAGNWRSRDISLYSLSGKILSDSGGYRVDSLELDAGGTHFSLSGKVGKSFTNDLDLRFAATPVDFSDISRVFSIRVAGALNVSGTIRGSVSDLWGEALIDGLFLNKPFENITCSYAFSNKVLQLNNARGTIVKADVNGSLKFDFGQKPEAYSFSGTVKHLDLREIGPTLKTDFSGGVHLSGVGFNEKNFAMSLDGALDSVRIENYYFDQVSGPASFDLKTIHFLPGFQARYKDTYITGTGYLEYTGQLDLTGDVEFRDLTNFTGQTFIKELGGRGKSHFHVTGPTLDFNVQANFESDSAWTYGLFPAQLNIETDLESFISHPVGEVVANWKGGTLYSLATDSGYFDAGVSGTRVFIDTASAEGPLGSIAMVGQYNGTTVPPIFCADTLYGTAAKNNFFSREPLVLNMRPDQTEFKRFILGLGSGTIQATGAVTTDLKLNMDVLATGFQIKPIVSQFYNTKTLSGIWWGQAKLRGDFANPQIDFDFKIDSLAANDTLLGDLNAKLTYRDKYLHTDSTHLASDFGEYYFSGDLPIDLSFGEVKNRFPNNPIDLRMTASGDRLLLSEVFIPNIERFATNFAIEMKLGGTYAKPTISGSGDLTNGTLKILDLVNPLTDVNAHLRMENETIYIDSMVATVPGGQDWVQPLGEILTVRRNTKPAQSVRASGTMRMISLGIFDYNIDINGKNFYFQSDAYDVRGLGDFKVTVRGENIPTVAGNVTLKRLEIQDEFDRFVTPEYNPNIVIEDSTLWNLNLELTAANNIWINNSDLNAELKGDLHVERQLGILTILGELDIIRGTYNLLGQRFQFTSGTMQFQNVSTVNPNIDFVISTRLRGQANQSLTTVDLNITGTLLEPKIGVASGSVVSSEDLLKYLVTGSQVNPLGASQSNFSQSLISSLSSTIPTFIPGLRGAGLFEELDIYPTPTGAQLSLAKYLSRSLSVSYSQMISTSQQQPGRTIGVEYYLNNNVSLNVRQGLQGTSQNNEGISFDLNLNFEY